MRILALESSAKTASVAILEDDLLLAEYTTNHKMTHSQTLLPMIDEMLSRIGVEPDTLDAIAVSCGPGSFTGLRIGSSTAKGLGQALNLPLIEVPTLEGLAYNLCGSDALICPVMDARRGNVYCALYSFDGDELVEHRATGLSEADVLCDSLKETDRKVIFVGDAVALIREKLGQDSRYAYATAGNNTHRAGSVAVAAAKRFLRGETVSAAQHAPDYLRPSQAEREYAKKEEK